MGIMVRRSVPADVIHVAQNMREEDRAEIQAAGERSPVEALFDGFLTSRECFTAVDDNDTPVAMFGVSPHHSPEVGVIWLLGTEGIVSNRISFLRVSRPWVEYFHQTYPVLTNAVDARNKVHMDWLRWVGCTFVKEIMGPSNLPFIEFIKVQNV